MWSVIVLRRKGFEVHTLTTEKAAYEYGQAAERRPAVISVTIYGRDLDLSRHVATTSML